MVELRSWRMPVAVVLLVAIALRVAASAVAVIASVLAGSDQLEALVGIGAGSGDAMLAAALAAVCWWAAADRVRSIRPVAGIGAALVIVQTLAGVLVAVATIALIGAGDAVRGAQLVAEFTWLLIPAVAAGVLIRAARVAGTAVARTGSVGTGSVGTGSVGTGSVDDPELPGAAAGELERVPEPLEQLYREAAGWEPDEAAGAVWTSAGEAASGAAAAGWGSAASAGGWGVAGAEEPDPDRPS